MDRLVAARHHAGNGILIAREGDVVYERTAGLRSVEDGTPFERDTVVRIYSMSKPVTTVALMMLAEKGLFHLDAPVSDFIPSFSDCTALIPGASRIDQVEPCATPTLHQLATHTSGTSYPFNPGILPKAMADQNIIYKNDQEPLAELTDRLAALPLAFKPGSRWEYSVGIDVLGRVIEVVSGKPLDVFLQQEVFDPLGMSETGFAVRPGTEDRFAALYTPLAGDPMGLNDARAGEDSLRLVYGPDDAAFRAPSLLSGGGGLVGTMDDYMKFAEMLRRGGALGDARLLSPRTLRFMMSNHLPGDIASMGPQSFAEQPMEGMGFGLGGAVLLNPARVRVAGNVGDFSWGGMASTFFWVDPVENMSVVFFTQLAPSSFYPTRPQIKAVVHAALTG
ncbi:serine hydrolase domain-containing protein [Shimia isoporae]|nr:serine hydrolase domain-containing protein [Shimia isoporae]